MLYPSRTARLALRAWREEDRPAFAAMNADERVMEYFPATLTAEESADLLDRIRDEFSTEGFGPYAVERLSDGELLGFTGLHRVTFSGGLEGQVEILWRLRHDAWGQGYALRRPGHASHTPRNSAFRNWSPSRSSETGVPGA